MPEQKKYYDPERGKDLRKTGRYKAPRQGLLPGQATRWSVSEMWEKHHEIKRFLLLGWKNVDIAKKLGMTAVAVSAVKNSPIVQEELALMRKARDFDTINIAKEIDKFAPKALKFLEDIISGDDEGSGASLALRAKSSESMLDRAGHGAINKVQAAVAYFTKEDIDDMKKRAGMSSGIPSEAA